MPFVYRGRVMSLDTGMTMLTAMTLQELIEYEKFLWGWMNDSPPNVVTVLNAIYREVEWRAQDTAFR
jgi:hypothetical protein